MILIVSYLLNMYVYDCVLEEVEFCLVWIPVYFFFCHGLVLLSCFQ